MARIRRVPHDPWTGAAEQGRLPPCAWPASYPRPTDVLHAPRARSSIYRSSHHGAYPYAGYGYGAGYGAYGYAAASPYYGGYGGYASPYSYGYRAFGKTTFPCISQAKMFEKDNCSA